MNKKIAIIIVTIIVIILIIFWIAKIFNSNEKELPKVYNKLETVESDTEFAAYSLNNINISNSNANLIFLNNINGKDQEELIVNEGSTYSFNKHGTHTIEVLELTDDYITISINGLAPRKKTGGFSLIDNYDKITIKRNTGICLNVQATDLLDGAVYFFYVNP